MGFMAALERGLAECGAGGRDVAAVVHATTVATNAIIEGKTARVGMLVTRGFRDILEIGRQIRSRLYDVHLQKPAPLVPAALEPRGDASGSTPRAACSSRSTSARCARRCARLRRRGRGGGRDLLPALLPEPGARARRRRRSCARSCPDACLSVSSEVCPEFREYLRASTAAVNAAVMPIVSRYVDALESRLAALGATAPFYVMQSNGGVMTLGLGQGAPGLHGRVRARPPASSPPAPWPRRTATPT